MSDEVSIQVTNHGCLRDDFTCKSCNQVALPEKIYKCRKGDLLCHTCIAFLYVQLPIKTKKPKCPICKTNIDVKKFSFYGALRDLIDNILPVQCELCNEEYLNKDFAEHSQSFSHCKYRVIGCNWEGKHCDIPKHLETCPFKTKD